MQGVVQDGVTSFKGIPFAAPPVENLRWKAPQPAPPWTGLRKAESFGPSPMQDAIWATLLSGSTHFSEDCLYLNVWTPAEQRSPPHPFPAGWACAAFSHSANWWLNSSQDFLGGRGPLTHCTWRPRQRE